MSNPYQAPKWDSHESFSEPSPQPQPQRQYYGMVHQVRVICILMGVQGVLELLAGMLYCGMGVFMAILMQTEMQRNPPQGQNDPVDPETLAWIFGGIYIGMGAPALLAGVLHIWAGIRNYSFRGRTLGLVALIVGLGSMATCYCLPTTIALATYGLIVYLNGPVNEAFQMGQQGYNTEQILATFSPSYAPSPPPPNQFR